MCLQIVTVNDYLARRDSEWVGQVHKFLGLEVGLVQADLDPAGRQKAYRADVTYVTNSELGFGGHRTVLLPFSCSTIILE